MLTRPVYILGGMRTPFVKSMTHYRHISTQDLMIAALQGLVSHFQLDGKMLGDVGLGALMNNPKNWNLARESVLGTTLNPRTPAYTLQRACGTSLETSLQLALKISNYQIETAIAGGVDSNSDLPLMVSPAFARKWLALYQSKTWGEKIKIISSFRFGDLVPQLPNIIEPRTSLSMGQHCEKMVKEWHISRAAQDELVLKSHQNAVEAYKNGFYGNLVMELMGLNRDATVRTNTSIQKLSALPTVFDPSDQGTLTAGNSSPLTDGAAAILLATKDAAAQWGITPQARFVDAQVAAVDFVRGEGLLMAPTIAVSELLKRNHLTLQDFDFYEIHEAFAGQVLCTLKAWESADYCRRVLNRTHVLGAIDRNKLNVCGGSVALGHPFAATGTRILATLAKLIYERGSGRGLISICTAGGMGIAAILASDDL